MSLSQGPRLFQRLGTSLSWPNVPHLNQFHRESRRLLLLQRLLQRAKLQNAARAAHPKKWSRRRKAGIVFLSVAGIVTVSNKLPDQVGPIYRSVWSSLYMTIKM